LLGMRETRTTRRQQLYKDRLSMISSWVSENAQCLGVYI
jgi:hypothetical protein